MEMHNVFVHHDVESQRSISPLDKSHFPESHILPSNICTARFGNPKPLGLFAFALTTALLSLINLHSRGVDTPNIVVGLGLAYGGLAQFVAGILELVCDGDTFAGVAFTSYGTFWIAYSMTLIPWFGIQNSYAANPSEFQNAMGHFIICISPLSFKLLVLEWRLTVGWFIFTALMTIATIRTDLAFFSLFLALSTTFLILAIGFYNGENEGCIKTAGVFGMITSILGWYNGFAIIYRPENSWIRLPNGKFPWGD